MKLEFAICLEKAQKGDSEAQRELGCLYRMGLGVNKDEAQAATWYQKAAEAGNTKAQFYLGRLYEEGLGIAKDEARAMQWYLKAAQGDQSLVEGLRANTTLTSIYLYNNQIGSEGAQVLAETLKTNTTLTSIELYYNQIGAEGVQALAEALKCNNTLTSISLYDNPINESDGDEGSEALEHISTFCKRNKALTQAAELYALFLACFPMEKQDAYLHLKEVTTSSTQSSIFPNGWKIA